MRKTLLTTMALIGITFGAATANAQLDIQISNVDPLTKLDASKWIYLMTHAVNAANLIGKDSVYVVNATGEDLSSITCRGYFLAGPKPYITNDDAMSAPSIIPKWTVTIMPTKGFNDYCKAGVDATGAAGTFHGTLNSADHSFENSTFVIFKAGQ